MVRKSINSTFHLLKRLTHAQNRKSPSIGTCGEGRRNPIQDKYPSFQLIHERDRKASKCKFRPTHFVTAHQPTILIHIAHFPTQNAGQTC